MFQYLGLILSCIYLVIKYFYSYWERKGFPNIKPNIPFGNLRALVQKKRSFGTAIYDLYTGTKEPFIGIYLFFRPALLIRDAELIKNILVKDFSSFHDRGIYVNEDKDPMSASLFAQTGAKWKHLRNTLTPAFTSGKLKSMLPTIMDTGKELQDYIEPFAEKNEVLEMKDLMSRYVIDIIVSVIFGCDVNTIRNPDDEFRSIVSKINGDGSIWQTIRGAAVFVCPSLLKFTGIPSLPKELREFMISIVKKTIEHREKNNVQRKDFMQLLLQLRNTGAVGEDGEWQVKTTSENMKKLSIEQCAAQVFIFYIAGFESSSASTSYCLYELCKNRTLMKRLQDEIDTTLKKHNGEITYDCINEMQFLELCLAETIRMYPALPILNRECTKEYQIPGSDFKIEKGTSIIISLMGIQRDAKYFPEPDKFIPDRFAEATKNYDETAYIPFGDGPRNCIGLRMGKIIIKVGLIMMLQKYEFELVDNKPMEFAINAVGLSPATGVNLRVRTKKEVKL